MLIMIKRLKRYWLCCVFAASFPAIMLSQTQEKKTYVAILSSYSYDHVQATTLAKTIGDKLNLYNPDIFVNILYAGMESIPSYTSGRFAMQGGLATCRINDRLTVPDLLVILGEEAWMMYRTMSLRGSWTRLPVILCGVRSRIPENIAGFYATRQLHDSLMIPIEKSGGDIPISGVIAEEDPAALLELINKVVPGVSRVHYVSTGSYGDIYTLHQLTKIRNGSASLPGIEVIPLHSKNRDSVKAVLQSLPANEPVILCNDHEKLSASSPVFTLSQYVFTGDQVVGSFTNSLGDLSDATVNCILRKMNHPQERLPDFRVLHAASTHLNKEALLRFNLHKQAKRIQNATYHNIPESYTLRNLRMIGAVLLSLSLFVLFLSLTIRFRFYKKKIAMLLENYRSLYNEYLTVYLNLPVGLMLYDMHGKLLNRNKESDVFNENMLKINQNFDIRQYGAVIQANTPYYEIISSENLDKNGALESRLVMAYDQTEAEQEKQIRKTFFRNLIFAMEKSDLGIAQYNVLSYKGFANRIWKKHLGLPADNIGFSNKQDHLSGEGRGKMEAFYRNVIRGEATTFMENIRVSYQGENHHLRYVIHILQYSPLEQNILAVEVIRNIDEQICKEQELLNAIHRAQESYKFKSAFITNMDEAISVFINNIKSQVNNLEVIKSKQLYQHISANIGKESTEFLSHLDKVIQLSKTESITT